LINDWREVPEIIKDWREVPDVGRNGCPYLCGLLHRSWLSRARVRAGSQPQDPKVPGPSCIPCVSARGHRDFGLFQPVGSGIPKRIGLSVVSHRGRQTWDHLSFPASVCLYATFQPYRIQRHLSYKSVWRGLTLQANFLLLKAIFSKSWGILDTTGKKN